MASLKIETNLAAHPTQQQLHSSSLASNAAKTLPSGFPAVLDLASAWQPPQFLDTDSYILTLDDAHLAELDNALKHFKSLGLDGDLVDRTRFPLPRLSKKLDSVRHQVYAGRGFGLVRGLQVTKYSVEDLTIIYLGIQCHIGNHFGRQDNKGNMLGKCKSGHLLILSSRSPSFDVAIIILTNPPVHIIADNSSAIKANHHRHSTAPITFHNEESGDVISWLTRSTAATGGKCIIASAHTVYNILAATRPDLIRVLARADWPFALPNFHCRPILQHHDGKMIINFGRAALMGSASHPRDPELPSLTPIQVEALDAIETIAKATQLEIQTKAGDMHFINNFAILHRREGFVNGERAGEKRHLVRTRLRDDEMGWAIPETLQHEWTKAFGKTGSKVWHLEPMPEGFFPLRTQLN